MNLESANFESRRDQDTNMGSVDIVIKAEGKYENALSLIRDLNNMLRLINIQSVQIHLKPGRAIDLVDVVIKAKSFYE